MDISAFLEGTFSILVAGFLLVRVERRMDELTKAIQMLRHCTNCRLSPFRLVIDDLDYDALPGGDAKHDYL